MRRIAIAAIAAAAGACLVAGTATYATGAGSAHPGPTGPIAGQHQAAHQLTSTQEKLKKTVVVTGYSGATLAAGDFTPIDAGETITCPSTGTCTLEADMSVQAIGVGTGDAWAVCFYVVDLGTYSTCPYYGNLDSAFYENGTQIESQSALPPGPHTVQTRVFTANGGTALNYNVTYHAYTP